MFDNIIGFFAFFLVELFNLTGNLGISLILFTVLVRSLLLPLTIPSIRAQDRIKAIQPEIKKLKNKFGKDKQGLQKAQLELYKKYNVNPIAGCLPQLVQIGIFIILYQVLIRFLNAPIANGVGVETAFLWLDLALPDRSLVLPLLAASSQLILSLMIAPGAEREDSVPNDSKSKKVQKENKKEEDFAEMAAKMQQQMIFIFPVMTGVIAYQFPSGLALYWIVTTVFSIAQQYFISGPGGLVLYYQRLRNKLVKA